MVKTIRAIFSKGVITPLEEVEIPEGKEITVTIADIPMELPEEAFKRAAGKWRETINLNELIKNIYDDRLVSTRPEVKIIVSAKNRWDTSESRYGQGSQDNEPRPTRL